MLSRAVGDTPTLSERLLSEKGVGPLLLQTCEKHARSPVVVSEIMRLVASITVETAASEELFGQLSEGLCRIATKSTASFGWGKEGTRVIIVRNSVVAGRPGHTSTLESLTAGPVGK